MALRCEVWNISDASLNVLTKAHVDEITRYGAGIIQNVAAFIGGVAAQEASKIIVKQFVPLNNTLVFNGIAGVATKYSL